VKKVNFSLLGGMYSSYRSLYQAGENAYGGVITLIRQMILALHFQCPLPNLCIIKLQLDVPRRLIGIYTPANKS